MRKTHWSDSPFIFGQLPGWLPAMVRHILQTISSMLLAVCFLGCNNQSPDAEPTPESAGETPGADNRVAEAWVSRPVTEWPQLVLTNHAEFNGHSSLQGASSFLIRTNDDRILAATAAHLIGPAGGVEPEIPINQLALRIQSWKMFPRTAREDALEVISLGTQAFDDEHLDWLVLSIKERDPLPAFPLQMRQKPVEVGESVFLIGCPYAESDCRQNVYTGTITERAFGDRFRYDIEPPVDIRGFSGAPIIDQKGYVVGVMTVWFDPKMEGDQYLEAGGEDIASIYDFVQAGS